MNVNKKSSLCSLISVNLRPFSQPLKVVVKHPSMTYQTHLFRQLDVRRSSYRSERSATPGTNDFINWRLGILVIITLRIDKLTQFDLPD